MRIQKAHLRLICIPKYLPFPKPSIQQRTIKATRTSTLHNSVSHSRFCPTTLTCLCIIPIRCSGVLIMIFFPIGRISLIFYHRCKCTAAVVKRHMLRFSIHTTQHKQQHRPKKQSNQFPNFLPPRLLIPYFGVS